MHFQILSFLLLLFFNLELEYTSDWLDISSRGPRGYLR